MRHRTTTVLLALAAAASLALAPAPAPAPTDADPGWVPADLRDGWGDARACSVGDAEVRCWRSEAAMDRWVADNDAPGAGSDRAAATRVALAAPCATYLKVYEHVNLAGRVLQFRDRGYWQNLSAWGFDDQASSWHVGLCAVTFTKDASGGGSWLWQSASTVSNAPSGWDDVISSLKIS